MEQSPSGLEQAPVSHVMKGITIALIMVFLTLLFYFTGVPLQGWSKYVAYAIYAAGIILSCTIYGKQLAGNVSFGNTFAHGFKVSAVVTVLMIAFTLILYALSPEIKAETLQVIREEMAKNPQLSPEQIDKMVNGYLEWFTPIMIAGALFGYLVTGLIASLIGAALTKKNPAV